MLHWPRVPGTYPEETARKAKSFSPGLEPNQLWLFDSHYRPASPIAPKEQLKIVVPIYPILLGRVARAVSNHNKLAIAKRWRRSHYQDSGPS